mmetsp:Transcript_22020/g.53297  ORF Transcript_22020/g.53297 Transcript_22020/m.53297 type:complete len:117 (+) Transcript_22020:1741-2091(+)
MLSYHGRDRPLLKVADFVNEFGDDSIDGVWPNSDDVHVHLHHMLLTTTKMRDLSQQQRSPVYNIFQDDNGLAGSPGTWYRMKVVQRSAPSYAVKHNESLSGGLIPLTASLTVVEYQ